MTANFFSRAGGAIATAAYAATIGCTTVAPEVEFPSEAEILSRVTHQVDGLDLCDGFYQPEVITTESQVYMTERGPLVELVCAYTAYQVVYAYVMYQPDGSVRSLPLQVFYPDEAGGFVSQDELTVAGLATYEPDVAALTLFTKGRGLGDCGSLAEYEFTGDTFSLQSYRYQPCDLNSETFVDPADYPLIYPAPENL